MASLNYKPSDVYIEMLNKLGDDEQVYKNAAKAAGVPLEKKLKQALSAYKDTGILVKSIKSRVKKNKTNGSYFVVARPYGTRKKGKKSIRNMEVFAYNEYGTSKTRARPVIEKVQREAESEATKAMEQAIEKRVKELGF